MRRTYVGIVLLSLMLAVGIALTVAFDRIHAPLGATLEDAGDAAVNGQWSQAVTLAESAHRKWNRVRNFTAAVADHEVLEQMDELFAQLDVWIGLERPEEFAAGCACMASLARALGQSQAVTWWNLF